MIEQREDYGNQGWNKNQHKHENIKSQSQTHGPPALWSIPILQRGWCFHGAGHWCSWRWRWGCKQHQGWGRHCRNSWGPCCHSGTWTVFYAGDFPRLIRPKGGATKFHHQPGLKGSELVLPYETEAGSFHLAPGPGGLKWNWQQAAKTTSQHQRQGSRLKTHQGAQSSLDEGWRDEIPSTGTSPYLLLSLEVPTLAVFLAEELAADGIWFSFWQQCWWQEGIFPVPRGHDSYSKSETTHAPRCDATQ